LVAPWLVIDNSKVIPWFLGVARKLPTVFQDSIIPSFATTMTTSSLSMSGSAAMGSENAKMFVVRKITGYSKLQGQDGNKQMVRLALEVTEIVPPPAHVTAFVFRGMKDNLVNEGACLHLIETWKNNSPKYTSFERADHNSVLAHDNLRIILATLV
jgi:hypothetical protein